MIFNTFKHRKQPCLAWCWLPHWFNHVSSWSWRIKVMKNVEFQPSGENPRNPTHRRRHLCWKVCDRNTNLGYRNCMTGEQASGWRRACPGHLEIHEDRIYSTCLIWIMKTTSFILSLKYHVIPALERLQQLHFERNNIHFSLNNVRHNSFDEIIHKVDSIFRSLLRTSKR